MKEGEKKRGRDREREAIPFAWNGMRHTIDNMNC